MLLCIQAVRVQNNAQKPWAAQRKSYRKQIQCSGSHGQVLSNKSFILTFIIGLNVCKMPQTGNPTRSRLLLLRAGDRERGSRNNGQWGEALFVWGKCTKSDIWEGWKTWCTKHQSTGYFKSRRTVAWYGYTCLWFQVLARKQEMASLRPAWAT